MIAAMEKITVPDYIRGLIFDCDGTLVDSMPLHMRAWEYVITSQGGKWDCEFFFSRKGMPEERIVLEYNGQFERAFDPAKTVRIKHEFFWARLDELKPVASVVEIARRYHGVLPLAVASGGTRKTVDLELRTLCIDQFFAVIITADDDVKPKPAPDIFLEAARRMRVKPQYCQVFEDGDLGLEAARIAGMLPTDIR
jgi:beta-phosphoglucomutase-like phosphatase (HAD superfamily)